MSFLLPILSGILLGAGFIAPFLNFLSWIALIPLLFFVEHENSKRKIFLAGFITGFIFLGMVISWYFETLPLSWVGIENNLLGFPLVFLIWILSTFTLAFFLGLFSLSYSFLKRRDWLNFLLIPSLWIIFEYLRAWGFSILWWGKESLLGPHYTLGNLGYLLSSNQNIVALASFGGIYFLSWILVFFNFLATCR